MKTKKDFSFLSRCPIYTRSDFGRPPGIAWVALDDAYHTQNTDPLGTHSGPKVSCGVKMKDEGENTDPANDEKTRVILVQRIIYIPKGQIKMDTTCF